MNRVRRSSLMLLVAVLFTLIPTGTPSASAAPRVPSDERSEAPPTAPLTVQPQNSPRRPGLALEVTVAPEELLVGDTATITLTVTNRAPHPAQQLVITLPTPDGAVPMPGVGFVSASAGWQWRIDRLAGNSATSVQAQTRVVRMPKGAALLAQPQVSAQDLPAPTQAFGGVRVIERSAIEASTRFVPGQSAKLQSNDGQLAVRFPGKAAARPLNLRASRSPKPGAMVPSGRPGFKRGWGTVFLTATDDNGQDLHQFAEPVTISMSYTPEQLQALGTTEAHLTIFWFDEAQQRWIPQPTTVDPQTRTASTTVDHFSAYQLSDGSSPSAAYIPSLQGFQVSHFTGAASYSLPIEVPAGAGGLKPAIELSYSSATSDGSAGARDAWQAGWVGKGWSLDPAGSVSVNKSLAGDGWNHYSFVFGGRSFDAVRGQLLPPYTDYQGDHNPAHWSWHAVDENFTRVRAEDLGGGNYRWHAWSKDGTRYSFTTPLTTTDSQRSYVYKWLLTEVVDVHGNRIVYDYHVDQINAYHPTAYLAAIRWGFDGATPGSGTARYKVEFVTRSRWASPTENVDLTWDYPTCPNCGSYWSQFTAHEAYRLDAIKILSLPPDDSTYRLVRQFNLSYGDFNASVQSDRPTGQRVLTLTGFQELGNDGMTALPATTFSYVPAGQPGANRLRTINNGQGGEVEFTYEPVWPTTPAGECACLYQNFYRVKEVRRIDSANPSAPTRALTSYEYLNPALNDAGHAASVAYAMFPPSGNGDSRAFMARQEKREFRGHESVIERQYNNADPATTLLSVQQQWFYQGDTDGCSVQISNNRLVEDACFRQMVEREGWKGRAYKTEIRAADGTTVLQRSQQTFARHDLPFYGSDSSVLDAAGKSNNYKRAGLWRAFSYEQQTANEAVEGSTTPLGTTTKYSYDPALQGGKQYGNVTSIEEFEGGSSTAYRVTQHSYAVRDDATIYLAQQRWQELITDGQRRLLALTVSFYDGLTTPGLLGSRGLLTQLRTYSNVPLQPSTANVTLHSSDTSYHYDAYGNQVSVTTYAEAGTRLFNGTTTTYSTPGNGSAASTTTTTYDNTFHAFSIQVTPPTVNGVTLIERAEYDYRMGTLTKVINPNNVATLAEYDAFGRMVKLIKPGDSSAYPTVEALYRDHERPFRYVVRQREVSGQPGYRSTQSFYDGWGRSIQTKRESQDLAQSIVTDTRYDAAGNPVAQSQPRYVNETGTAFGSYTLPGTNVQWTTTSYDARNRPLTITQPDGTVQRHRYFLQGGSLLHDTVNAKRQRTVTRSDAWGRRVQVDEFAGACSNAWSTYACAAPFTTPWTTAATTSYRYSPLDLLEQVTDALGNVTTMAYDSLGRKRTMTDPDMGTWHYAYAVTGNLTQQTDAKGQTTTFQYDVLGRLIAKRSPDGRSSFYGYDEAYGFGKGQRTSMSVWVNGTQQSYTSFYYDQRGRPYNQGHLVAGLSGARHLAWTYDSADRVTSIRYPSNETVSYTYDQAWRQTSVCSSLGGCYATHAQYTALDQPLSLTFGNNLPQTWQYTSPMQRLSQTTLGSGGTFARRYTYDLGGNVASIVDPNAKADTQTFTYDHRDRLTGVTGPTPSDTDTYRYDALGNLLEKGGQSYLYGANGNGTGAGPHQVRSKGGWRYTYDANGNLVSHNGRSYSWNSDNLPSRITIPTVADETYTYDADGERLTRTVNGVTTVYLAGLWEEEIPSGVTRSHYTLHEQVVAQRSSTTNEVLYLHRDHLGSVSAVTDANGLLVSQQDFTPWGEIRSGGSGIAETSLNYTGQRRDRTGLLYYHARYYDPNLGRFLSADTVVPGSPRGTMQGVALTPLTVDFHEPGFLTGIAKENNQRFWFQRSSHERQQTNPPWGPANAQALNRYAYVLNNPLKYTDPTGHTIYLTHDQATGAADLLQSLANDMNIMSQLADVWVAGGTPAAVELLTRLAPNIAKMLGGTLLNIWVSAIVTIYVGVGIGISNQLQALADTIRALNGKQGVALQYDWWGATSQRMAVMNRENGTTVWVGFPIYVGPFIPEEFWIRHNAGPARKIGDKPENGNCLIQSGRPVCSGWKTYL